MFLSLSLSLYFSLWKRKRERERESALCVCVCVCVWVCVCVCVWYPLFLDTSTNSFFIKAFFFFIKVCNRVSAEKFQSQPRYFLEMWPDKVYFSRRFPVRSKHFFLSILHCLDLIGQKFQQKQTWRHHMKFSAYEYFSPPSYI